MVKSFSSDLMKAISSSTIKWPKLPERDAGKERLVDLLGESSKTYMNKSVSTVSGKKADMFWYDDHVVLDSIRGFPKVERNQIKDENPFAARVRTEFERHQSVRALSNRVDEQTDRIARMNTEIAAVREELEEARANNQMLRELIEQKDDEADKLRTTILNLEERVIPDKGSW